MRRLARVPLLLCACLLPANVSAVGLGSIEMNSALNQRLDAEIPLRGVSSDQVDEIVVALAPESAFRDVGLPRPHALTRLRFEVVERGGDLYVHATSTERITEPYLSFLIEVDAPAGNLLREYTVLLDPPVYASEEAEPESEPEEAAAAGTETTEEPPATETAEADATAEPAAEATAGDDSRERGDFGDEPVFLEVERERDRAEEESRRDRDTAEAEATSEEAEATTAEAEPARSYTTGDGDTTWEIAARLAGEETSVQQMMLALLRYNPEAFVDGNVNRLRSGYVLRLPTDDEALAIDVQQAIARVEQQNTLWREWRDEARRTATAPAGAVESGGSDASAATGSTGESGEQLQIVGASEGGEVAADEDTPASGTAEESRELQMAREELESARLEKEELEERVGELESTVERMERLITVRDEQLEQLQDRLIELAEREDVELDPELLAEAGIEDEAAEEPAEASAEPEVEEVDIDIVSAAEMQTRLAEAAAMQEQALAEAAEEEAAEEEAEAETDTETAADEEEDDDEAVAAAADDGAAEAPDPGVETVRTQPEDESWLSRLMSPVSALVAAVGGVFTGIGGAVPGGPLGLAGIAAAVLGLAALLIVRRRQQEEAVEVAEEDVLADEPAGDFDDLIDDGTADEENPLAAADSSGLQEAGEDAPNRAAAQALTDEDPLASIEGIGTGEDTGDDEATKDDTVAEADVYLAYGLHQQARDLLTLALQENPQRADYHEKLLETLYSAGDKEAFENQVGRFQELVERPSQGLWNRVVAMGRDIAPDNELFRQASDPGVSTEDLKPSRPSSTDFDLDAGGPGDLDLDFSLDNAGEGSDSQSAGEDFDQTMALHSGDLQGDDYDSLVDGLGGLVGDSDETAPSSKAAGSDPTDDSAGAADDELEFDLGDLEGLTGDDDSRNGPAVAGGEARDEADMEDVLAFDLSDLDSEASPAADTTATDTGNAEPADPFADDSERPAATAGDDNSALDLADSLDKDDGGGLEEDFAFDLSDLEAGTESSAEDGDDGLGAFDLADLDTDAAPGGEADSDRSAPGDAAEGGEPTAVAETNPDDEFDLSELEQGADAAEAPAARADEFDLSDLDTLTEGDSAPDTGDTADESDLSAMEADFDLSELETSAEPEASADTPAEQAQAGNGSAMAGPDEVGSDDEELETMLDLAKAYFDMGDAESATSALEEVIAGGSERQRQEAQQLLDSAR